MIIKHLSAHISIFSIAMALEDVPNHFFGLKTEKVIPKQVFELEKGPISSLPLETQRTHLWKLSGELLRLFYLKIQKSAHKILACVNSTKLLSLFFLHLYYQKLMNHQTSPAH
jgi:hypothetical protein